MMTYLISNPVSYTHLRAHKTDSYLVCRLLLEKMTELLNTIIELSAKKKQSFDSTMDGDQIKMQIYNERLMILEGL